MALLITSEISTIRETPVRVIIKKYADDHYCLELLRFFGTYPSTRFSELAITHALDDDGEKSRILNSLGRLAIDGTIKTCIENGNHLYQLSNDESLHDSVVHLAEMDWRQWHMMLAEKTKK